MIDVPEGVHATTGGPTNFNRISYSAPVCVCVPLADQLVIK